jgi:hypothetical protein
MPIMTHAMPVLAKLLIFNPSNVGKALPTTMEAAALLSKKIHDVPPLTLL